MRFLLAVLLVATACNQPVLKPSPGAVVRIPRGGGGGGGGVLPELQSITIAPASVDDNIGYVGQLIATGTFNNGGGDVDITSSVLWASDNDAIATVTNGANGGDVTLVGAGSASITASLFGITSNSVSVSVNGTPIPYGTSSGLPTTQVTSLSDMVFGRAFVFPSDDAGQKMYIGNRVPPTYVNQAVPGTNIMVGPSDGLGNMDPVGAMTFTNVTIPLPGVAGTGLAEFLELDVRAVPLGPDNKRVARVSIPNGSPTVSICDVEHHGVYYTGTQDVVNPGTPAGPALLSPYTIHWRGGATLKRRLLGLGDSIMAGATLNFVSTTGYENSAYYQLAAVNDWAVNIQARPGATLADLANPAYGPPPGGTAPDGGREWDTVEDLLPGIDVIGQRGTNDVSLGLVSMQASLAAIVAHLQGAGVRRIYWCNVAPALAWAPFNSTRLTWNAYLDANWASIGLYAPPLDVDSALRNPANHDELDPLKTTDGTHLTPLGQSSVLGVLQARL